MHDKRFSTEIDLNWDVQEDHAHHFSAIIKLTKNLYIILLSRHKPYSRLQVSSGCIAVRKNVLDHAIFSCKIHTTFNLSDVSEEEISFK